MGHTSRRKARLSFHLKRVETASLTEVAMMIGAFSFASSARSRDHTGMGAVQRMAPAFFFSEVLVGAVDLERATRRVQCWVLGESTNFI